MQVRKSLSRLKTNLFILRDKAKFGGANKLRQKCLQRLCVDDPRKAEGGNKRKERSCSLTPDTSGPDSSSQVCVDNPRKAGGGNKRNERSCSSTPNTSAPDSSSPESSSSSGSTSLDSGLEYPIQILPNVVQVPALLYEKKEETPIEDGEYFELHSPTYCPPST